MPGPRPVPPITDDIALLTARRPNPDWQQHAACAGQQWLRPDAWHAHDTHDTRIAPQSRAAIADAVDLAATAVCWHACPVRLDCLADAIDVEAGYAVSRRAGIRGGRGPDDRHVIAVATLADSPNDRYAPAGPSVAHLRGLRDQGATIAAIADVTGVAETSVRDIIGGQRTTITRALADKVLTVTADQALAVTQARSGAAAGPCAPPDMDQVLTAVQHGIDTGARPVDVARAIGYRGKDSLRSRLATMGRRDLWDQLAGPHRRQPRPQVGGGR